VAGLVTVGLVVGMLAGCQRTNDAQGGDWHPDAQFAPSLRPAFGARMTDGELRIWTGSPCVGVTRLAITLDLGKDSKAETVLTAGSGGATVERVTLGSAPQGLTVKEALPAGYDWSKASTAQLSLSGPPATWGSSVDLVQVRDGSGSHPGDTYFFQGVGWLDAAQVAAQDGKTFLATCTRDPAKS
jgi:hypothetical protein